MITMGRGCVFRALRADNQRPINPSLAVLFAPNKSMRKTIARRPFGTNDSSLDGSLDRLILISGSERFYVS